MLSVFQYTDSDDPFGIFNLFLQLPMQSMSVITNVVSSNPAHGEVYLIQHYVIKIVSDLRQDGGFLRVLRFPPINKTDRHDITEILLKMALNNITTTLYSQSIKTKNI